MRMNLISKGKSQLDQRDLEELERLGRYIHAFELILEGEEWIEVLNALFGIEEPIEGMSKKAAMKRSKQLDAAPYKTAKSIIENQINKRSMKCTERK